MNWIVPTFNALALLSVGGFAIWDHEIGLAITAFSGFAGWVCVIGSEVKK